MQQIKSYQFENELRLLHIEKKDFVKSFASVVVNYGAKDLNYDTSFPLGIAHFLEHKMFEKKGKDYLEVFSEIGASVNAFTSFNETAYYFSTSEDLKTPLNLLLDLVSELDIDAQSVEKEKGIICEELSMIESDPETKIFHRLFENLYYDSPIRYDIGGTKDSVNATTLSDLKSCFELFYNPNNLVLVVVSSTSFENVKEWILSHKIMKIKPKELPVKQKYNESIEVVKEVDEINVEIQRNKTVIGYKLPLILEYQKRKKIEASLNVLINLVFTPLNPDYQKWISDKKINDYFGCYVDFSEYHSMLLIYDECEDEKFLSELKHLLSSYDLNETMLNQIKKRLYSTQIRLYDQFERLGFYASRSMINQVEIDFETNLLKQITIEDLKEAQVYLTQSKQSILYAKKAV